MTPNDEFTASLSAVVNASQSLAPNARDIRRTLGNLLADALRLEADADRLVRALKHLQPTTPADAG